LLLAASQSANCSDVDDNICDTTYTADCTAFNARPACVPDLASGTSVSTTCNGREGIAAALTAEDDEDEADPGVAAAIAVAATGALCCAIFALVWFFFPETPVIVYILKKTGLDKASRSCRLSPLAIVTSPALM